MIRDELCSIHCRELPRQRKEPSLKSFNSSLLCNLVITALVYLNQSRENVSSAVREKKNSLQDIIISIDSKSNDKLVLCMFGKLQSSFFLTVYIYKMFIKPNSTMVFSAVTKKKTFFSLHGSITTKSLLNSLLVLCVFVKMNLFLLDSVDKKN